MATKPVFLFWGCLAAYCRYGPQNRRSANLETLRHGHRRHRASLLEDGVELYEVRADALQALGIVPADSDTGLVMHTKLAVIDQTELFVGSLNFDPRSIKQNTEFGVFIHSPDLVKGVVPHPDENLAKFTYRVMLRSDGDIEWHYSGKWG